MKNMKRYFVSAFILAFAMVGCAQTSKKLDTSRAPSSTDELFIAPLPEAVGDKMGESYTFLQERAGKTSVPLERCKGTATLHRVKGRLTLSFKDVVCSNLVTKYGEVKLKGEGYGNRYIDVTFDDTPGWHKITIGSIAYLKSDGAEGNGDHFYVYIPQKSVTLNLKSTGETNEYKMPNCGGSVQGNIKQGRVNIVFRDSRCGRFDILSNDGESLKYDAQGIPAQGHFYGGSFQIPPRFYDLGSNGIQVKVYTPFGAEDRILVKFNAGF